MPSFRRCFNTSIPSVPQYEARRRHVCLRHQLRYLSMPVPEETRPPRTKTAAQQDYRWVKRKDPKVGMTPSH
ncbi:hypothetical protein Krac_1613 [Ktedonobacter racemifer DSM 44963]|uniref:Uncharacterized protein n=1 Tax=Ktedonobacter racemifer DSM 44963 TaxID=485913 RepID=D6U2K4_KTERA|nr:hypothetical protein Krac_1613 [Ktedonobacter racemifer DSM 44963]